MSEPTPNIPRPTPAPSPTTAPYWEALGRGELLLQRCATCTAWVHYPRRRCPVCMSNQLGWEPVEPVGTIHTFTVARRATAVPFASDVPQIIAIVELANGVKMTTTLTDVQPDRLRIGQPVHGVYEHQDDGTTLLRFTL
jgi:uncharacterized OB-fold protein